MASCRFCGTTLHHTFVDLGMSPLCESYLSCDQLNQMEPFYPLHVYVCGECFLVQLEAYVSAEHIFSDYAYFSSYSDSWVEHCRVYAEQMVERSTSARGIRSSNLPATTATCSSTSSPKESRSWASSRRRTWPRPPAEGHPDAGQVLRGEHRPGAGRPRAARPT